MKRVLYIIVSIIGALLLSSSACEEIINPQDDGMLIDKTVAPSSTETILSKGNDIQIIIPGGALSEDATFKVEKNSNPPAMNLEKMILGKNTYKIKITGQTSFNTAIQIVINYSQSILEEYKLTTDDIRGLIYTNGNWAEATYTIDQTYNKIIISINSPTGKTKQNNDIPLDDGEIIIGDGYSTVDSGTGDNLLKGMNNIFLQVTHTDNTPRTFRNFYSDTLRKMTWNGNNFSLDFNSRPGHPHSTNGLMGDHYIFKFTATSPSSGYQKINSLDVSEILEWSWLSGAWFDSTEASMKFKDIPLVFTSQNKDTIIYEILDAFKSSNVQTYNLMQGGVDFFDMSEYYRTYGKSELSKVKITFTK